MEKEIVIDNNRIKIELSEIGFNAELCDITEVGNRWAKYARSGLKRVKICGVTKDGTKIDDVFRYKGTFEQDILILESLNEPPVMGQEE